MAAGTGVCVGAKLAAAVGVDHDGVRSAERDGVVGGHRRPVGMSSSGDGEADNPVAVGAFDGAQVELAVGGGVLDVGELQQGWSRGPELAGDQVVVHGRPGPWPRLRLRARTDHNRCWVHTGRHASNACSEKPNTRQVTATSTSLAARSRTSGYIIFGGCPGRSRPSRGGDPVLLLEVLIRFQQLTDLRRAAWARVDRSSVVSASLLDR